MPPPCGPAPRGAATVVEPSQSFSIGACRSSTTSDFLGPGLAWPKPVRVRSVPHRRLLCPDRRLATHDRVGDQAIGSAGHSCASTPLSMTCWRRQTTAPSMPMQPARLARQGRVPRWRRSGALYVAAPHDLGDHATTRAAGGTLAGVYCQSRLLVRRCGHGPGSRRGHADVHVKGPQGGYCRGLATSESG